MFDRIVVRVSTLAEFTAEVRSELPLRLSLSLLERSTPTNIIPSREIELHLQGHNDLGEIIWLMESHRIVVFPSGPETPCDRSIYQGMQELHRLVEKHLTDRGYEIRPGAYGLPDNIKPLHGRFEIVKWQRNNDDPESWTIVPLDQNGEEN
jgi:hypothetical protein